VKKKGRFHCRGGLFENMKGLGKKSGGRIKREGKAFLKQGVIFKMKKGGKGGISSRVWGERTPCLLGINITKRVKLAEEIEKRGGEGPSQFNNRETQST